MEIVLAFVIYLLVALLAYLGAEVYPYSRHYSCPVCLVLIVVGAPWFGLVHLLKQDGWVGRIRCRFRLKILPVYDRRVAQSVFDGWRDRHRAAFPEEEDDSRNGGFESASAETIEWFDVHQMVQRFNYAEPVLRVDNRSGIAYFYMKHPAPSGNNFIGEARIVRAGAETYGVYSESYGLF